MTVVGLHPEELFDKLLEGELSGPERERLNLHLAGCEVCRFEYAARLDFQAEALTLASGAPPPLLPLRTPQPAPAPAPAPVRRRRSRALVWGLAAAALIVASGAVAAIVSGNRVWRAETRTLSHPASVPAALRLEAPVTAIAPAKAPEPAAAPLPLAPAQPAATPRRAQRAQSEAASVNPAVAHAASSPVSTPAASPAKDSAAAEAPTAAKLFTEANQARRSGDVGRASGLYHLLQEQFPGSSEAQLSRVTLSLLLLDGGDAQGALSGFERYLAGASRGLEAEALVGRARALGRLGRRDLEATAWQEVQRKYPRSIYGRQAGERLSALGVP